MDATRAAPPDLHGRSGRATRPRASGDVQLEPDVDERLLSCSRHQRRPRHGRVDDSVQRSQPTCTLDGMDAVELRGDPDLRVAHRIGQSSLAREKHELLSR
jgi:hypothetical protein